MFIEIFSSGGSPKETQSAENILKTMILVFEVIHATTQILNWVVHYVLTRRTVV